MSRLEDFFDYWTNRVNSGEVSSFDRTEVTAIRIYNDWLTARLDAQAQELEAGKECRDALEELLEEARWHDVNRGAIDWATEALAAYDKATKEAPKCPE